MLKIYYADALTDREKFIFDRIDPAKKTILLVPDQFSLQAEQDALQYCGSALLDLMVTDFSGIQFDFAYMRKPLVYIHHKDIPQHYEEGSFFYDTMAFGEITHDNEELIDVLISYMESGCKMKEEYVRRADDFFYFRDHKNCSRIYKEMIEYQKKYILPVWE